MTRQLKVKVRPDETLRFPGLCVNCISPATESMQLEQRDGRIIRRVDVPLCDQCAGLLRRESGDEERMRKLSWLVLIAASLLSTVLLLLLMDSIPFWIRLTLALIGGAIVAAIVRRLFQRLIEGAALPAKKEVRQAARLESFSWRTATFVFANESFAERFVELNEPEMVEI